MDEEIKNFQKLINQYPQLGERLSLHIESLQEFDKTQKLFYSHYAEMIAKFADLFVTSFQIAISNSPNPKKLIKLEIKNIRSILNKGKSKTLIVNDWSDILKIEAKEIQKKYGLLIRGLELPALEEYVDRRDIDGIHQLEVTRALILYKDYLKSIIIKADIVEDNEDESNLEQHTEILNTEIVLKSLGFYDLKKVSILPKESQKELTSLFAENSVPYRIALLDFLGFFKNLEIKSVSKKAMHIMLAKTELLGKNERAIRGNINVLDSFSTEDRNRYTADIHQDIVQRDYQNLK